MWGDKSKEKKEKKTEQQNHQQQQQQPQQVSYGNGSYRYKMFKCFNRKFKINEFEPPSDVKAAFSKYAEGGEEMTPAQLMRFMVEHQHETERQDVSEVEKIVEQVIQVRHQGRKNIKCGLSLDDFFHFLFADDLNGPIKTQVHNDMAAPLSHYFIYTGHNSYLTGNQLSSDCSEVPIAKALQRGVRVIELDLWPNSTKDDINVLHGRTLTTPVPLIKCLKSIRDHAFLTSPYPVIITLEDHLTAPLQAKAAEMATQIFGPMLYYPEAEYLAEFPSPESLKHRIIISTKPPVEYLECTPDKNKANSLSTASHSRASSEEETSSSTLQNTEPEAEEKTDSDEDQESTSENDNKSPEYKRLITIHAGKPKGALKDALRVEKDKATRLSLSEMEVERAASSHSTDLVRFTQRNIVRIYPKGTRVNSSNYKPLVGWIHGAQMIAFNMQGYGKSLWLMHGMFRANGGCGYVKKPDFLMNNGPNDEIFDPKKTLTVKKTLKVKVYMGDGWRLDFSHTHFDTYSPPDFYTKLDLVGVPADNSKKKTKVRIDDWSPVWDENFTFPLTVPELALLRIEVGEYDMSDADDFGGQTCLPVGELRPGIRSVPLHDKKGQKFRSVRLLMRFDFL